MKVLARTVLLCIATVSGVSSSTELGAQTREPPYIIVDDEANAFAIIGYIAGSALVLGGSAVLGAYNSIGNRHGQHKTVSMLGVAAGVGAVGLAAFTYENNRGAKDAGKVSAGIATLGALSVVTGVRGLLRRNAYLASRRAQNLGAEETTIAPMLPVGGNGRTGLSLSIRF